MANFEGFSPSDFEAYAPHKWASFAYNLERLQVKEKLVGLAGYLLERLAPDHSLSWAVSAEHPALWNNHEVRCQELFFLRPESDQQILFRRVARARKLNDFLDRPSPYLEHVHLVITVDHEGLTCALAIMPEATVDHENTLFKLEDPWRKKEFLELIGGLSDSFEIRIAGMPIGEPSDAAEALAGTTPDPEAKQPVLHVARHRSKQDQALATAGAADAILEDLKRLLPLYRFLEWRRDNDYLKVVEEVRQEKRETKKKGLKPGDRVRILSGLFSGRAGTIQDLDSRGQARVLVGTMTVQVHASDLSRLD